MVITPARSTKPTPAPWWVVNQTPLVDISPTTLERLGVTHIPGLNLAYQTDPPEVVRETMSPASPVAAKLVTVPDSLMRWMTLDPSLSHSAFVGAQR